ncbi:MAG: ORC1-type DNA replication protein [Candidatus Aenigmarchaeota archaeon]|nr:ORC1-type DNA replication protein [Candidatus Aenigmarchaeota archaeon]
MRLLSDETLFRNEDVFDFSYIPDQFNYRDSQLKALAYCLKPAMRGAKPLNALLIGPPATGKTTAVKLMFNQFEEESDKAVLVHVNCQIHSSQFRVFSEIHRKIIGHLPPETGVPLSGIYDKIFPKLKKVLIVALDDINYLQESDKILYDLLRAHESYPGIKVGVIAISQKDETHKLSDRVRSVFQPELVRFEPYKKTEIAGILRHRAEAGLYNNVVSLRLIDKIAELASENNDLRFGIALLKKAVMNAELDGSRVVKKAHIEKAISSVIPEQNKKLEDNEKLIMDLTKKDITSGELYKLFSKKTSASYSSFYRLLEKMEKAGLIKTVEKIATKGGKTRIISKVKE